MQGSVAQGTKTRTQRHRTDSKFCCYATKPRPIKALKTPSLFNVHRYRCLLILLSSGFMGTFVMTMYLLTSWSHSQEPWNSLTRFIKCSFDGFAISRYRLTMFIYQVLGPPSTISVPFMTDVAYHPDKMQIFNAHILKLKHEQLLEMDAFSVTNQHCRWVWVCRQRVQR